MADTKLLLHCNGDDASTTFTDETGKTVTAVGTAQIDTAQSKFGGASGLFDGNSDYLSLDDSADFTLGTTDFTIDLWVRFSTLQNAHFWQQGAGTTYVRFWYDNAGHQLNFGELASGSWGVLYQGAWTPSADTWYHIAVIRSGTTTWKIFVDGTDISATLTTGSASRSIADISGTAYIGALQGASEFLAGWIDEFRFSLGIARWTSNFTPSTVEYTGVNSASPSVSPSASPSTSPSQSPSSSRSPSVSVSSSPSLSPSSSPSASPSASISPSSSPSASPSASISPSSSPSASPSISPSASKSASPSASPSVSLSSSPSLSPSISPSVSPSISLSSSPSVSPSIGAIIPHAYISQIKPNIKINSIIPRIKI